MDVFETKIRGNHAKAVQNIMARTTGYCKLQSKQKAMKSKGDNITTYLRKFQIDKQNLNLAKRILLCQSQHDHKIYEKEWKKTENFLRVRSNFKRNLCNEQPRLFKFQPIQGIGNCLITLIFTKFQSSPIYFRSHNLYEIKALIKNNSIAPTNSVFNLSTLGHSPMSLYIPKHLKKKKMTCKISQIKQNQIYNKGKMIINLANQGEQQIQIINKQGKVVAVAFIKVLKQSKDNFKKKQSLNDTQRRRSQRQQSLQKQDNFQTAFHEN